MFDVTLLVLLLVAAFTTVVFVLLERARGSTDAPTVTADIAVGVVRRIAEDDCATAIGERSITIDVETRAGRSFTGRLRYCSGDPVASRLRPGTPVLVAFDPAAPEHLSLPDQITVVRAAFDQMLIRDGVRSRGIVTAVRATGEIQENHREFELDLMVSRIGGGQFPAQQTTFVPVSADIWPGCIVDTYYHPDDESVVTVCVRPNRGVSGPHPPRS
ncbi:hypothetical protein BH10ACT9_BH10ACT9_10900 [soil metagenome]